MARTHVATPLHPPPFQRIIILINLQSLFKNWLNFYLLILVYVAHPIHHSFRLPSIVRLPYLSVYRFSRLPRPQHDCAIYAPFVGELRSHRELCQPHNMYINFCGFPDNCLLFFEILPRLIGCSNSSIELGILLSRHRSLLLAGLECSNLVGRLLYNVCT